MTGHLLLIFAYHFPPENEVGALRAHRFYKYLSRLGWRCHVITAASQAGESDGNVECLPDPFLAKRGRGLGWQGERLLRKTLLPGVSGIRWSYRASREAGVVLQAHPGARVTLLSTYPPLGTHLAAWQLARSEKVRWIADFRDPLANNPADCGLNGIQRRVLQWLEWSFMRSADRIIANTDAVLEGWREQYPHRRDDMHLIWNGFDPEDRLLPRALLESERKVLSHVGELYSGRTATPLLESIGRLIHRGRVAAGSIRVRLVGPIDRSSLPEPEFVERAQRWGWLELVADKVPQRQAREITQTSDGLVLLQPQSAVQVPGKLFEYLQIGRPILAFVPRGSPVERILRKSGVPFRCVYTGDSPEAADDTILEFLELDSSGGSASSWFEEQFNAEKQAQELSQLIRSLWQ